MLRQKHNNYLLILSLITVSIVYLFTVKVNYIELAKIAFESTLVFLPLSLIVVVLYALERYQIVRRCYKFIIAITFLATPILIRKTGEHFQSVLSILVVELALLVILIEYYKKKRSIKNIK